MPGQRRWRRREAVIGGVTLAAGVAAPRALARPSTAFALPGDDAAILGRLLDIEQALAVAYEAAAASDVVDAEVQPALELFADQEREHAEALASALADLGRTPPGPPRSDEIDGVEELDSQSVMLEFFVAREREAIALYGEAATLLAAPDLLKTGAQIVGNETQHLVVLRQQLGEEPVSDVFPSGTLGGSTAGAG
jgi:rubrerythrin